MAGNDFDSPLVVYLEAQGDRTLVNITDWSIDSDYLTSCDGFDFTLIADNLADIVGFEGEPVRLSVGGAVQLVGRIDQSEIGDNGTAIKYSGRDYISDLVECNIDPTFVIKEKQTLGAALLASCEPIGIKQIAETSDVKAVLDVRMGIPGKTRTRRTKDNKSKAFKSVTLQDLKPDIGQGLYEFWKPICARHGCTIQPTYRRDTLLISGPYYEQEPAFSIFRSLNDSPTNIVVRSSARRDYSSYPTHQIVQGQGAPRSGEKISNANLVIDAWGQAQYLQGEIQETLNWISYSGRRKPYDNLEALSVEKLYRLNVFRDDKARTAEEVANAARRLFADHLKRTLEYSVTLRGHIDPVTGALWAPDTIVYVHDEPCQIMGEELWVQSRKFSYRPGSGATTELLCIRPGSFEI